MKEFIALKPLEITIDSIGIHRYVVELAGDRYQVPLAPSQLCKPLPDIVHCVIMKTDTGIDFFNPSIGLHDDTMNDVR